MRILRSRDIIMPEVKLGFQGHFTVELIDAKTQLIKRRLEFPNLITDAGLNALGTGTGLGSLINAFMGVGTGSTVPANGQTALVTEIAPASTNRTIGNGGIAEVYGAGASYVYWYRRIVRLFTETQGNGNLTELGLFDSSSGGVMFARQLFKDALGSATTITKTSSDQLRVTYEIRLYSPSADVTVNPFTISGSNYSVTTRAINIAAARAWGHDGSSNAVLDNFRQNVIVAAALDTNTLAANVDPTPGTVYAATTNSRSTYVGGDFFVDLTTVFDPGAANPAGGIGSIAICTSGQGIPGGISFQQAFTPKLPKDNTKRLTIVNRVSWGRYP